MNFGYTVVYLTSMCDNVLGKSQPLLFISNGLVTVVTSPDPLHLQFFGFVCQKTVGLQFLYSLEIWGLVQSFSDQVVHVTAKSKGCYTRCRVVCSFFVEKRKNHLKAPEIFIVFLKPFISDTSFDQRPLVHREVGFPKCDRHTDRHTHKLTSWLIDWIGLGADSVRKRRRKRTLFTCWFLPRCIILRNKGDGI